MHTFRRLLHFLAPYRRGVVLSGVLALVAMVMTISIPYFTGRAVDGLQRDDRGALVTFGVLVGAAGLGRFVLMVFRRLVAGKVSLGVELDLRDRLYTHLLGLELAFFDRQQTGQLMSRATVDLQAVRFFLGYGLVFIIQSGLTLLLAAGAMALIDPTLAAVSLAPVPFVVWAAVRYGLRARPALQEVQQRIAELTADVEENVGGVRVVKAFAREQRQERLFTESVGRVFSQALVSTRLQAFYNPLIGFLPQLGLAVILLFGGRRVIDGTLTTGEFTAFYTYLLMLLAPMRMLGVLLGMAQRATAAGARLFQILDTAPAIAAPATPRPLPDGPGHVRFEGVGVRYSGATTDALHDVDLEVRGGRTIAVVGGTGSGKTTLVQLLSRLYDPTAGRVLVDGVDVRELDPHALRREIAFVTDDPFLFSTTVRENIAYGRPDAGPAEVEQATRRAQAHEFVQRLPDGYDTRVGERGMSLSGGQRQRLAIARAFVADPRILVLDDATSAVDATTEQAIKDALQEVMAGRTTFVIAHRLSTIALADEILVLEDGRVAAHGSHDELLDRSGLYRQIVEKGLPDQVFLTRKPREPQTAGL